MATAIQVGLVPGFALQDGDLLAELIGGSIAGGGAGGGFGMGNTANGSVDLTGSSNNNAVGAFQVTTSVIVINTVTATGNSVQLPSIAVSTSIRIYNFGLLQVNVFPPTGQSVDISVAGGGPFPINASTTLAPDARCDYLYLGNNQWASDLLGSPSN